MVDAACLSTAYTHVFRQQTWQEFHISCNIFIFLIRFILFCTKKYKVFNYSKNCVVSNLVLMFSCIIKVHYQSPYISDITYPWYFSKLILLIMRCAYVTEFLQIAIDLWYYMYLNESRLSNILNNCPILLFSNGIVTDAINYWYKCKYYARRKFSRRWIFLLRKTSAQGKFCVAKLPIYLRPIFLEQICLEPEHHIT